MGPRGVHRGGGGRRRRATLGLEGSRKDRGHGDDVLEHVTVYLDETGI